MDNWNHYQANINDEIASIYLEMNYLDTAPIQAYPKLAWYWIKLEYPREDGLSSKEEFYGLCAHEDALTLHLSNFDVKYVGRITNRGRREFYFYLPDTTSINDVLRGFIGSAPKYLYQIGEQDDVKWNQYLNVLYPGPSGLAQIEARDVYHS